MAQAEKDTFQWLNPDFPKNDARDAFVAHTSDTPLPLGAEHAFLASKLHILRTHPLPTAERDKTVQDFLDNLGLAAPLADGAPVGGGGVGYGMFYTPAFKTAFQSGTGLAWSIVFSDPPGGNVGSWLYLTGMNRASMGAEAFIAYQGQSDISFNIFDWACQQWRIHRPISTMAAYVGTVTANGTQYPVMQIANLTYQTGDTNWVNEVRVLNYSTGALDVAYQYAYDATLVQQTSSSTGSWAAIVETYQPSYSGTGPMGCLNAAIASPDVDGTWGSWARLDPAQVSPRSDNKGFNLAFLDPAFSWVVSS